MLRAYVIAVVWIINTCNMKSNNHHLHLKHNTWITYSRHAACGDMFRDHCGAFLGGFVHYFSVHWAFRAELEGAILAVTLTHLDGISSG